MAEIDRDELKRLSPEERISRLRAIEVERKKDLAETEKLIRASMEELDQDEGPPEIPKPEESGLEQTVTEATVQPESPEQNVEYAINLYNELTGMASEAHAGGYSNIQRAAEIYDRLMVARTYESSDKVVKDIAEGSRRLMKELFDDYKANLDYTP